MPTDTEILDSLSSSQTYSNLQPQIAELRKGASDTDILNSLVASPKYATLAPQVAQFRAPAPTPNPNIPTGALGVLNAVGQDMTKLVRNIPGDTYDVGKEIVTGVKNTAEQSFANLKELINRRLNGESALPMLGDRLKEVAAVAPQVVSDVKAVVEHPIDYTVNHPAHMAMNLSMLADAAGLPKLAAYTNPIVGPVKTVGTLHPLETLGSAVKSGFMKSASALTGVDSRILKDAYAAGKGEVPFNTLTASTGEDLAAKFKQGMRSSGDESLQAGGLFQERVKNTIDNVLRDDTLMPPAQVKALTDTKNKMITTYQKMESTLLSAGDDVSKTEAADKALRILQRTLKEPQVRGVVADLMSKELDDINSLFKGRDVSQWLTNPIKNSSGQGAAAIGIGGELAAATLTPMFHMLIPPAFVSFVAHASPRAVGEFTAALGNTAKFANKAGKVVKDVPVRAATESGYALGELISNPTISARAIGGPVVAGKPYLVGENGAEVIVPQANGTVIPNYKLSEALGYPSTKAMTQDMLEAGMGAVGAVDNVGRMVMKRVSTSQLVQETRDLIHSPIVSQNLDAVGNTLKTAFTRLLDKIHPDTLHMSGPEIEQALQKLQGFKQAYKPLIKADTLMGNTIDAFEQDLTASAKVTAKEVSGKYHSAWEPKDVESWTLSKLFKGGK